MLDTIIVAAGQSRRMALDKMTLRIAGRTILEWSFAACAAVTSVRRIVVVCAAGREEEFHSLLTPIDTSKKLHAIVPGGAERSDSVAAGIAALAKSGGSILLPTDSERSRASSSPLAQAGEQDAPPTFIAIHDAARPFVRPEAFEKCFARAREIGAAALAERVVDTLHRTDEDQRVAETVLRENLWRVQTPQIARRDWLAELHNHATDEIGGLVQLGYPAVMVENPFPNPKITTPTDLPLAEAVAKSFL